MELTMSDKGTNDDFEHGVGEVVTRMPPLISAALAVGGLVAAYFMTIGDFKVKDMELSQRVSYIESKVNHLEETIDVINSKLDRRIPVVDADRQDLRQEIENLKEVITQMKPLLKNK